jgi:biotin synthase
MIDPAIEKAYAVLDGRPLDRELALELSALRGEDILDLVSLANKVRNRYAREGHVCTIMNAKSGACGENCRFCAQSGHHGAEVEVYPLQSVEAMLDAARAAYDSGVRSFGLVTSGTGFMAVDDTFQTILDGIDAIHAALPGMRVCASLGILSDATAKCLAEHGVQHYNINLQTDPARYADLVATTHGIDARIETVRRLQRVGVGVCCGGILGLGESMADRVGMAYALRELDVEVIPLNVLVPIAETPLAESPSIEPSAAALTFALFRLINPTKVLKFAAGRESRMRDFQGLLMLAGVNGMLVGGYLTTRGRDVGDDDVFARQLQAFTTGAEPLWTAS